MRRPGPTPKKYLSFKKFWNQYKKSITEDNRLKLWLYIANDKIHTDDMNNFKPYHSNNYVCNILGLNWNITYDYDSGKIKFKDNNKDIIIHGESIITQVNQIRELHNNDSIDYCYMYMVIEDSIKNTFTIISNVNDEEIKLNDPTPINVINSNSTIEIKVNIMDSSLQQANIISEKEIEKINDFYKETMSIIPFKMDILVGIYKGNKVIDTLSLVKDIDVKLDTDKGYVICTKTSIIDGRQLIDDYIRIKRPKLSKTTKFGYMYKIKTYPCNNQTLSFMCNTKNYLQANGSIILKQGPLDLMPMF